MPMTGLVRLWHTFPPSKSLLPLPLLLFPTPTPNRTPPPMPTYIPELFSFTLFLLLVRTSLSYLLWPSPCLRPNDFWEDLWVVLFLLLIARTPHSKLPCFCTITGRNRFSLPLHSVDSPVHSTPSPTPSSSLLMYSLFNSLNPEQDCACLCLLCVNVAPDQLKKRMSLTQR